MFSIQALDHCVGRPIKKRCGSSGCYSYTDLANQPWRQDAALPHAVKWHAARGRLGCGGGGHDHVRLEADDSSTSAEIRGSGIGDNAYGRGVARGLWTGECPFRVWAWVVVRQPTQSQGQVWSGKRLAAQESGAARERDLFCTAGNAARRGGRTPSQPRPDRGR